MADARLRGIGVAGAALALVMCSAACEALGQSATLPPGFQEGTFVSGLVEPTVMQFLPDGRLLIGQRGGVIRVVQNGALLPTPLISLAADTLNERGLVGLAIDPNFSSNGFIYVYYTSVEPRNRVARLTVVGNTAAPVSETVIWQSPDPAADFHHGGAICFGGDGNLYIATGDQFNSANAQDVTSLHGKILRLRPDGSIPPDNPYLGTPGAQPALWAVGLRNPFRTTFDPAKNRLWIGNVGGNTDDSWEEVNLGVAAANYGWPQQEGPECFTGNCAAYALPAFFYRHSDPQYYYSSFQASLTLGPVYHGTMFPAEYQNNLFIGDYANRWIRRLVLDDDGHVQSEAVFAPAPLAGTIVDLKVGPDGALYYLTYGVSWRGPPDAPAVHCISYVGTSNRAPVAAASATPLRGPAPLAVQFSSSGSSDPDNGPAPLTYAWTFGDGATSHEPNPSHVFAAPGRYEAFLIVSDGASQASSASLAIEAGAPPAPVIAAPAAGLQYRAGDVISFNGSAEDSEDGPLSPAALTWQVLLIHAEHAHPFAGPLSGISGGSFTIPSSGHAPAHTSYLIQLTAVDSDGLTTTVSRPIAPLESEIVFDTLPSGIPLFIDGEAFSTPQDYDSLTGFEHHVEAQPSYVLGTSLYYFRRWADGAPRVRMYVAPEGGGSLTAQYGVVGDMNCDGVVNNFDIEGFVLMIVSAEDYQAAYPECDVQAADINLDGRVNNFDIDPFIALIIGS